MAFAAKDAGSIVLVSGPRGMDLVDPRVVATMWRQFADLDKFESHVIDTTEQLGVCAAEGGDARRVSIRG